MKTTMLKNIRSLLTLAVGMAALSLPGWVRAQDPGPPLGQYEGRLPLYATYPDDSHLTNGYLCVKVSAKRVMTGTVAVAGYVYRIPKGTQIAPDGTTVVIPLTHRTGPPAELQITSADGDQISGRVNRVGQTPIEFGGMSGHALQPLQRYSPKAPFPFAGLYTVCLDQFRSSWEEPYPIDNPGWFADVYDETDFLGRYGYGLVKISAAGRATVKGQLPDGTKYTAASCARAYGPDFMELWVYAPILKGAGSVVGPLMNEWSDPMMGLPTLLTGGFESGGWRWYVGNDAQPLNDRTWLEVSGSEYTPPAEGEPILGGGGALMTNVTQVVIPDISPTGINAEGLAGTLPGAPNPATRPAPKYLATVSKTGAQPSQVTFQFNPKTGAYKASFVHPSTLKKMTAYGAVVQWMGVYDLVEHMPGYFFEELVDVVPGGHCGVFVNRVRQPDKSYLSYPGWLFTVPEYD